MSRKATLIATGVLGAVILSLFVVEARLSATLAQQPVQAPTFEVDPFWPKPLPNNWVIGSAIGVGVDSRDHVYIVHRAASLNARTEVGAAQTPPTGECCVPAPPVLEFDPEGNLVNSWGGPGEGYTWPASNHGIAIDHRDNVWIGGNGQGDSQILIFGRDGKFVRQLGEPGKPVNSQSREWFGRVAKISFDARSNEAFVADGYGHKRVAVLDMTSGAVKRFWGAYGNVPSDSNLGPYNPDAPLAQQFRNPVHCAEPSVDGLVYVCDRPNNRIQVFRANGEFVTEVRIAPRTLGDGAVWDIAFSRDPQQRYLYLADGKNEKVYVMDRQSLDVLTSFGGGGRQPGQFFAVHSIATDSRGNIFTTETYEGKRVQRFVYRGMRAVTRRDQGPPWPVR
jgi:DNA-binding beta-propeller fold protein YncE